MPKKRIDSASKTAEKLAAIALRHLSKYSEEEQEERISRAEKLVATAARVGTSRTPSSTPRTRKTRVLPELDEHLLEESPVSLT
jgi:hypothetical protein